jgi:hypothetical protein
MSRALGWSLKLLVVRAESGEHVDERPPASGLLGIDDVLRVLECGGKG